MTARSTALVHLDLACYGSAETGRSGAFLGPSQVAYTGLT
jgi:hypothetical protein